jgi:hypothetical protein
MSKRVVSLIIVLLVLSGLVFIAQRVFANNNIPDQPLPQQGSGSAGSQGIDASPDALTSFTISNPYCYQPNPAVDQCSINFRYISATDNQSASPYMTWLSITISNKTRFNATAFFEGTITYSYDMVPDGWIVPCGAPNASGVGEKYGFVYGVTVQPLDSSRNPMSTDVANLTCPAYAP